VSEEQSHELLIIKRSRNEEHGHHGGAWKIAFADFMTAMMALFLVLWLVSATSEKTKVSIARYFNPVKLVDMSTMKRGVSDPNENISTSPDPPGEGHPKRDTGEPPTEQIDAQPKDEKDQSSGAFQPKHSETALFRDPYAVLAEIVATEGPPGPSGKGKTTAPDVSDAEPVKAPLEPFKDPFKLVIPDVFPNGSADPKKGVPPTPQPTVPGGQRPPVVAPSAKADKQVPPGTPEKPAVAAQPPAASDRAAAQPPGTPEKPAVATQPPVAPGKALVPTPPPAADKFAAAEGTSPQPQAGKSQTAAQPPREGDGPLKAGPAVEAEAGKLRSEVLTEIAKAIGNTKNDKSIPNIEIKANDEGILISLTDQFNYSMFAIGSAEPQARTIEVMTKVAEILKKYPGPIIIRGHTDARPYKGTAYDNWRLSSARAHMAHYMLVRGGLDDSRIDRIEGFADRKLKNPKDPFAAENRRIEILLKKDHV
jgi:chemotaxis protein MotB